MNPTAASTGHRGDALGVVRICAWTLIAASAITLAGCCLIVALIVPEFRVSLDLGPQFARSVFEYQLWYWIVHLILELLF